MSNIPKSLQYIPSLDAKDRQALTCTSLASDCDEIPCCDECILHLITKKTSLNGRKNMFKNKKELTTALMEGRRFVTTNGNVLFYNEDRIGNPFAVKQFEGGAVVALDGAWDAFNFLSEEKPWYEALPEKGLLCYVWDDNEELDKIVYVVTKYTAEAIYPFKTVGTVYQHASPLTMEEMAGLLYKGEV